MEEDSNIFFLLPICIMIAYLVVSPAITSLFVFLVQTWH